MGRMDSLVIDTNVLAVANGKHPNAADADVFKCQEFLEGTRTRHVSVDTLGLIFEEYFKHADRSGQPGIGDAFAKWLWHNQWDEAICEQVVITPDPEGDREFLEFPDDEALSAFDRDDRKFVAVAVSSQFDAVICNASDSDWWDFRAAFEKHRLNINFLCPELIKQ